MTVHIVPSSRRTKPFRDYGGTRRRTQLNGHSRCDLTDVTCWQPTEQTSSSPGFTGRTRAARATRAPALGHPGSLIRSNCDHSCDQALAALAKPGPGELPRHLPRSGAVVEANRREQSKSVCVAVLIDYASSSAVRDPFEERYGGLLQGRSKDFTPLARFHSMTSGMRRVPVSPPV